MNRELGLLVMGRGNSLEENPSLGRINVWIHPRSPCCKCRLKSNHTVHVLHYLSPYLDVIPSELQSIQFCFFLKIDKKKIQLIIINMGSYGWEGPLRFHQCHVLKMSMSMFFHSLPPSMESSFKTRPIFSRTTSTKYTFRSSITFTP